MLGIEQSIFNKRSMDNIQTSIVPATKAGYIPIMVYMGLVCSTVFLNTV